jgi:ribonuclease P protein component
VPLTSTVEIHSSRPLFDGALFHAAREAGSNFAMPPKKARFPRTARLLRHADFERVYKQGRRHFSASMTVFYCPRIDRGEGSKAAAPPTDTENASVSPSAGSRVGFTVGRALGGAVVRNRMKRRLREAVRLAGPPCTGVAADVVINPKKSLLKADFADVVNEVRRGFAVIEQKLSGKTSVAAKTNAGNSVVDYKEPEGGSRL